MSSAVFTLENHDKRHWGYYGSLVMAAANFGTLLGSFAGWSLREFLTDDQLFRWGWRIPFLSGIFVSASGFYLRAEEEEEGFQPKNSREKETVSSNPIKVAFARDNLRSLMAAAMVPMLWSSGFYLSFVWMAIFMADLIENPVPGAFGINATALFFSVCLLFPLAGIASDRFGRRIVMTVGGLSLGCICPFLVNLIGKRNPIAALASQVVIGIALSCWGAPMIAWLVESFEPEARLTSVAVGYNIAQATIGGLTPALATWMVDHVGPASPGYLLTALATVSRLGLWVVKPASRLAGNPSMDAPVSNGGMRQKTRSRRKKVFSAVPKDEEGLSSDEDM
jgi:MFS transporter, MHS family, proline/betaine transporter